MVFRDVCSLYEPTTQEVNTAVTLSGESGTLGTCRHTMPLRHGRRRLIPGAMAIASLDGQDP